MSLLDEIRERRLRLSHTTTTVTTAGGKVFKEESSEDGFCVTGQLNKESRECPGFVIDLKPDLEVAEVIPGLCLGSQDVTQEPDLLRKHNITDIVSLGVKIALVDPQPITCHFIPVLDLPETEIVSVLDEVLPLVHNLLGQNKVVFVHCNAGVSRSPTIVIAYLIKHKSMLFEDAFKLVQSKRASIKPNPGFIEQLKKFQTQISCKLKNLG